MTSVAEIAEGLKKHPGGFRLDPEEKLYFHDPHENIVITDRRVQSGSTQFQVGDIDRIRTLPFMSPTRNRLRHATNPLQKVGILCHALLMLHRKIQPVRIAAVEAVYHDRQETVATSKLVKKGDHEAESEEMARLEKIATAMNAAIAAHAL